MTIKTTDDEIIRLVNEFHFKQGMSLRSIERAHGLSNDTMRKRCVKLNIKTKSKRQSIIDNEKYVVRPSGEKHWSKTNPSALATASKASSERMTKNNPIHKHGIAEKIAKTNSNRFKKDPTFHESLMIDLFDLIGIPYEFQPVISKYIPDFVVCGNVIVEIDGRGHASRKASDLVRDQFLCGIGFYVVRIDQDLLFNKRLANPVFRPNKLIRVIGDLCGWVDFSGLLPSVTCKHRVIVRKPNPFTEVVY